MVYSTRFVVILGMIYCGVYHINRWAFRAHAADRNQIGHLVQGWPFAQQMPTWARWTEPTEASTGAGFIGGVCFRASCSAVQTHTER